MSKRVIANLIVFMAVFAVMIVWAVRNVVTVDAIERPYELSAQFDRASGVGPNAEVAYLGVHFGRVTDVELQDDGVLIHMLIDRDREIPRDSTARIFRKSAIGEPYIDFNPNPGADLDDTYAAGDVVPVEKTQFPLEFSELLRTFSELLAGVDPAHTETLIHELALALDGRAADLRRLTEAGDQLAATFAERTDVLDRLAVNNTRLTSVFADHRASLGQSLTDLSLLAESLRNAGGDTSVLLDRGTALLAEVGALVEDTRPNLDCLLTDLVAVNDLAAAPDQLAGLAQLLAEGPTAFDLFSRTRDVEPDGTWVRVFLQIGLDNPPEQYVPPKELPVVPAVPACPGATAVGPPLPSTDFRPSDVLGTPGASLPATGAAAGLAVAGVAVAGAWTARRLRRMADGAS